ncbi:TRAM domain-containing protein [candidate division WWE3 bacterium]|uniref:TRAM domain-containing protein n=1 Tax=candidate division WWE3 bacterium TaxID=2053526 RepID=A0A955LH68_UNCKA|nr:TRAM domain-containing protein [candidate division WWE3 bacterium]
MKIIPNTIRSITNKIQLSSVIVVTIGLILGLLIGALLSVPIGDLEWKFAGQLSLGLSITSTLFFTVLFYFQKESLISAFNEYWPIGKTNTAASKKKKKKISRKMVPLTALFLDSSAIIDGRIADIARTGFLEGELIVTSDILGEIKRIADSKEPLRKQRGRRALDILDEMRKAKHIPFKVIKTNNKELEGLDVDDRLVHTASNHKGKILTTDYNLHKKAKIMGITVLNVNELANMVKTVLLPGETIMLEVIQEGKGNNQGIGYLPDGTMVVVEGGDSHIGKTLEVEVKRLLQTDAGKMIFTHPVSTD